jgi:hypothetical protein
MNPAPRVSQQPSWPVWTCERLLHEHAIAWGMALDRSSLLSYLSALQSYLTFCSSHAFPPEPTPDTLSLYVVCRMSKLLRRPEDLLFIGYSVVYMTHPFISTVCYSTHTI